MFLKLVFGTCTPRSPSLQNTESRSWGCGKGLGTRRDNGEDPLDRAPWKSALAICSGERAKWEGDLARSVLLVDWRWHRPMGSGNKRVDRGSMPSPSTLMVEPEQRQRPV